MLLPQSSAFAALKNRLNSVSNIGFLHTGPRRYASGSLSDTPPPRQTLNPSYTPSTAQTGPSFDRGSGTRLKRDDPNTIKWTELLDKFKSVQERARRTHAAQRRLLDPSDTLQNLSLSAALSAATTDRVRDRSGFPDAPRAGLVAPGGAGVGLGVSGPAGVSGAGAGAGRVVVDTKAGGSSSLLGDVQKQKSGLSNLGRLGIGGRKSKR